MKFGANICGRVQQGNPGESNNNCEGQVSNVEHLSKIEAFSTNNEFITCFSRILNLWIFATKFYVSIFKGLQSVFSVISAIFDLKRKLLSCGKKIKNKNFVRQIRRFGNRENMWWARPMVATGAKKDLPHHGLLIHYLKENIILVNG